MERATSTFLTLFLFHLQFQCRGTCETQIIYFIHAMKLLCLMRLSALLPMLAIAEMTCAQSPLIKGEMSSRDSQSRLSMTKFENLPRAESGSGFAEIKVWNPSVSSTHILTQPQHARKTQKFHAPMATRAMLPANMPSKINAMMVANNLESGTKRGFVSIDVSETPTYTVNLHTLLSVT